MPEVVQFVPRLDLDCNKVGIPYSTLENFKSILKAIGCTIRFNEIKKDLDIIIPGKSYSYANHLNCCEAQLSDYCVIHKMAPRYVMKHMLLVGDENKFNPVRDWIESKEWDGVSRVDQFYETIKSTNEKVKRILLQRWMVSACAALYEPDGISAGGMLVLFGKQYLGKTNWFKNLVPQEMKSYIADGMSVDPHDRDSFMPCLENWLVELGEIDATFKKSDLAALKAFINRQLDTTRLSYAAKNSRFHRRTIFFGSVDKKSYLSDPSGNRRFWTIECKEINHTHGLDMQQVWAEFAQLYHAGEPWLLTKDEHELLNETNKQHETIDPLEEKILKYYDWDYPCQTWKSATEIYEELGFKNADRGSVTRCGLIIRKLNGDQSKFVRGRSLLAVPTSNVFG